eukprot:TRINITY_DN775851_c0_g1_i1.p1 TRINITY_DN775851_c0_g1~~TRINITY_DN775851_c0_g1_i1.p1  ORF type:complete len:757 (+),score=150.43 TRINITY_DN775851_c0_g1_i1:115-2385(+)
MFSQSRFSSNPKSDFVGGPRVVVNGVDCTPLPLISSTVPQATQDKPLSHLSGSQLNGETNSTNGNDFLEGIGNTETSEVGEHNLPEIAKGLDKIEQLAEDENELITIKLRETGTVTLFSAPAKCVNVNDDSLFAAVSEENNLYENLLDHKTKSDLFESNGAQTLTRPHKTAEVSVHPPTCKDAECMCTTWEIHDSQSKDEKGSKDATDLLLGADEDSEKSPESPLAQQVESMVFSALSSHGCLLDPEKVIHVPAPQRRRRKKEATGASRASQAESSMIESRGAMPSRVSASRSIMRSEVSFGSATAQVARMDTLAKGATTQDELHEMHVQRELDGIATSPSLLSSLKIVERTIQQNLYHKKHLLYRDVPSKKASNRKKQEITELFRFNCDISKGKTICDMSWNHANPDLLAVAYGSLKFGSTNDGCILLWSQINPDYPELHLPCYCGVSSIAFSKLHPHWLAAGRYDGSVCIYDIRKKSKLPVLESNKLEGKHSSPVWQVEWVDDGPDKGESLVSISSDGRVTRWSIKKGLVHNDLMVLKRLANSAPGASSKDEGVIARHAAGMCFRFVPDEPSSYFVGTQNGLIHKCSTSYNEQYIDTWSGHTSAVNCIQCSPFNSRLLLSCSEDWSLRIWDRQKDCSHDSNVNSVLTLRSMGQSASILDAVWSPRLPTVLASVSQNGHLDIWDLSVSILDPVVSHTLSSEKCQLTSALFAPNAPVIVVGDDDGIIHVMKLSSFGSAPETMEAVKILDTLIKSVD